MINPMTSLRRWAMTGAWLLAPLATPAEGPIVLRDVTRDTGITFQHTDGSSGRHYIVETVSAGLALFDYDNDGDVDIYFLNGAPLPGTKVDTPPRNALYRNDGNWTFTDVTAAAGVGDTGYGLGVAAGDVDNDGDEDLYLNNYGANVLYRNNGDGTFTDVTPSAGVGNGQLVGAGAAFLDYDGDGDLDLYAANYIDFTYEKHRPRTRGGYPSYLAPINYEAVADTLYRNDGNGRFTDVSMASGVAAVKGRGMGMVCADYDDDGDTDVFVGSDVGANLLFENQGDGTFEEVGLLSGLAYSGNGSAQGTMGVAAGDYDNDGRLDFHATSYESDLATLYRNMGEGFFEDATRPTGAGAGTFPDVTWGNEFVDLDNDGHRDLFIACGHLEDYIDKVTDTTSYHVRNVVLRNRGGGRFVNVSDPAGDGLAVKLSSRGSAFDDLDNDGDLDVVILNSRREPTLLRNDSPTGNHWLQIELQGTGTNRDGVGARVKVIAGDLVQIAEVQSGRGYQSHYGTRLHFGLGAHGKAVQVEVRWIGGGTDVFENVAIDRLVRLVERASK
ncbi:MAG: CRTAC1 family protein [Verrucomicrobiota bacterium]